MTFDVGIIGQSNVRVWKDGNSSSPQGGEDLTAVDCLIYDNVTTFTFVDPLSIGNGQISFGDKLASALSDTVRMVNRAKGGSALLKKYADDPDDPKEYWLNNLAGGLWDLFKSDVTSSGATLELIIWGQGEQDAYAQIIRLSGDCLGACCVSGECTETTEGDCPTGDCVRDPEWLCDGDVDGDGQVNPVDSGLVQAAFGSSDEADLCQFDIDCDGQINPVDSGIVQSLFGTCDEPRATCGAGAWFEGENCEDFECP